MTAMILLLLVAITLYSVGSVGIVWLICTLTGWPFSVPMAIGVFLIANFIIGTVQRRKRRDRK